MATSDDTTRAAGEPTTWAYRFQCPACGYESVTQDEELRDAMLDWHNQTSHDGERVATWETVDDVPVSRFPDDETVHEGQAVTTTTRTLGGGRP